jgi:plasmid stabilization system protein ParE
MQKPRYWMTATAKAHYLKAIHDTYTRFGPDQAEQYRILLIEGFRWLLENHLSLTSPHRQKLTEGTEFGVHLIGQRYVVFQKYKNGIILVGIFHKSMDLPTHLKKLQALSKAELATMKTILHGQGQKD